MTFPESIERYALTGRAQKERAIRQNTRICHGDEWSDYSSPWQIRVQQNTIKSIMPQLSN